MAQQLALQGVPSRSGALLSCDWCRGPFQPYKRAEGYQRYCSPECRTKAWKREHDAGEEGKALAAQKNADDLREAREAAELLWTVLRRPISIDDVREACETGGMNLDFSRNWVGSVFRGWLFCGTCKARHEGSHGRRISLWRKP